MSLPGGKAGVKTWGRAWRMQLQGSKTTGATKAENPKEVIVC